MRIIKVLFLSALLLFSEMTNSATVVQAKAVYAKLIQANNLFYVQDLIIVDYIVMACSDNPKMKCKNYDNASSRLTSIIVTKQFLASFTLDDLAMVLGHEIAHLRLLHGGSTHKNEYAADKLAAVYAKRAGFNVCKGVHWMRIANDAASLSHPSTKDRIKALGCAP